jgi:tetratricopeptide (TPR) repeat protein
VERSTVVRWERGETEPVPWLRPRLAKALRISAERLAQLLDGAAPASEAQDAGAERTGSASARHAGGSASGNNAPTVTPRQLPATIADFTGRAAELAALNQILDDARADVSGTVVISAIGGTAGVGKTTLALHWAHRIAGRFPDGQLHANLRGFDLSGAPATPEEAVRGFLAALGIPSDRIPPGPDAQAGLYRSLLADKRVLIVLDNARSEQQVRPLLPANPGSLIIVTSRNQLTGLAAANGARLLSLDVLAHDEAIALLTTRIGTARATAEPDAITEIATLCACLPLAIAVAAARAAARPRLPLSALAAELRNTADRLDALDSGDPSVSVRAVFSWSYQQLGTDAARMFRLLGLHPGPEISVPAAASLAATNQPTARRILRTLAHAHLISEYAPGRYAFHDLLRAYAAAQAHDQDSAEDRHAATERILHHYLHTAGAAALLLNPGQERIAFIPPSPGVTPEDFDSLDQARSWLEQEHDVLLSAITFADAAGFDVHAWQLPIAVMVHLAQSGYYPEWVATMRAALAAAKRTGDEAAQATTSRRLAAACNYLGDHDEAFTLAESSRVLYHRLGDRRGEAVACDTLREIENFRGHYAEAQAYASQALAVYRDIGDRRREASALNSVGWFNALNGDYEQTREQCSHALAILAEVGASSEATNTWDSLGYAAHHLGDLTDAVACYERALANLRQFPDVWGEATVLTHLGDTHQAAGDPARARHAWQRALTLFNELNHTDAAKVRAKLANIATVES